MGKNKTTDANRVKSTDWVEASLIFLVFVKIISGDKLYQKHVFFLINSSDRFVDKL